MQSPPRAGKPPVHPCAFKALDLAWEDLSRINPRLIYCSMTAFGQDGPRGGQTAYDNVIQAMSGLMATLSGIEIDIIGNDESYNLHLRTADVSRTWQSYRQSFVAGAECQTRSMAR